MSEFCVSVGMDEQRHLLEDTEDIKEFADLKVDSVVDLVVSVADEMLDAEMAGMQKIW